MVSFYISKTTGSKLTFGGYLENMIKENYAVVWENIVSDKNGNYKEWEVEIKDLIFQDTSVFSNKYHIAEIGSSFPYIYLPMEEMTSIARILENKFGSSIFFCSSNVYGMICAFV